MSTLACRLTVVRLYVIQWVCETVGWLRADGTLNERLGLQREAIIRMTAFAPSSSQMSSNWEHFAKVFGIGVSSVPIDRTKH